MSTSTLINNLLPIGISFIALLISWYVAILSRRSFIAAQRPFVWASSRHIVNPSNNFMEPMPKEVAFSIKNAPAKIQKIVIQVTLGKEVLVDEVVKNQIRFPDEGSQSGFVLSNDQFIKVTSQSSNGQEKLIRKVEISYSSLDGSGQYSFILVQSFDSEINDWREVSQTAN